MTSYTPIYDQKISQQQTLPISIFNILSVSIVWDFKNILFKENIKNYLLFRRPLITLSYKIQPPLENNYQVDFSKSLLARNCSNLRT